MSVRCNNPNGNMVEFCLTTGTFTAEDRQHALAMMDESEFKPSPAPPKSKAIRQKQRVKAT